ncbi:glycosyltransferase involved in cell wall biosynthesis [Paenibacillus endophyticus]|uniref:Glycosyltransferase involved in cell wall biosynthesis n=1 Tax=Paenibacillus endophyticus TaxID=1294268 RepID=A0A7W5C9G4_9BACL|nr:glycosyltransferase family 4 protein [Paenibacillus endophyticus]MBB3153603.1 glycosyltransferase involved in cell wall biosynthesis [Paenibacillus endophyticus]
MSGSYKKLRIGYSSGSARMVNERAIDSNWVRYMGQHAELVPIPPLALYRLFGGSVERFVRDWPKSLQRMSEGLLELRNHYDLQTLYLNIPALAPYLFMGRTAGGIDLGFLIIAHSVASEHWLRQWLGIAPFLSERDVLLCSTPSSKEALCRISPRYRLAKVIPLAIERRDWHEVEDSLGRRNGRRLLSIGRLEDVKNMELLLRTFAAVRDVLPDARLTVAGEYTGRNRLQIEGYKARITELLATLELGEHLFFANAVEGKEKEALFSEADLLVNVSTDPGETFGYNLLEAKAWGVPAICAGWNGFRDVVNDGEDGLLVPCEWDGPSPAVDECQASKAVLSLLMDDGLRRRMSRKAVASAERYDYRNIFPAVVREVELAAESAMSEPEQMNVIAMMGQSLPQLGRLYQAEHLRKLPFLEQSLLRIVTSRSETPLTEWMPLVKPIASHYAGRNAYAEH